MATEVPDAICDEFNTLAVRPRSFSLETERGRPMGKKGFSGLHYSEPDNGSAVLPLNFRFFIHNYSRETQNMAHLTIVANIIAKADKIDLVKSELTKLIEPTLTENGCVQYDLHQDNDNPAHFLFFENWESRELWQVHTGNQNLKDYMAATDGAIEEFTLHEMTKLS